VRRLLSQTLPAVTPDITRGRRQLRTLAVGGALLLFAPDLVDLAAAGRWRGLGLAVVWPAVLLGLCALLYRGHRWPRPLVAAAFWLGALGCAIVLMMAGGPLIVTSPSPAVWGQGAAVVAAGAACSALALLAGSHHLRAFVAAQRAARAGVAAGV